ncbi:uncharacterized protein LOC114360923 [Ostrinia furnacalis]|uniref:uncharacterized protein LOC114360923 n=1 Tax=Ostrinia furnacalis TaxID=93504 RepID=UPI00103D095B|nr:uncharacterized protein LOC114360923 [Ostrinia furnacalis]
MDSVTSTEDLRIELKTPQENILLELIEELCSEPDGKLSTKLKGKVNRIIADCDLTHHTSLHKLSTADESTSTLLGFMHNTAAELNFEEQAELNQAIVHKIQNKLPTFTAELERLRQSTNNQKKSSQNQVQQLQESLDQKLNTLKEQENEKVELMMEWLNHRINDVSMFSDSSSEFLTLKTRILDLKSKILHLQILQNIFTETNQSIKAYSEIHKDLKDSIKETEQRIKGFREIINSDYD